MPNSTTNMDKHQQAKYDKALLSMAFILIWSALTYEIQTKAHKNSIKDFLKSNPLVPILATVVWVGMIKELKELDEMDYPSTFGLTLLSLAVGATCGRIVHAAVTPAYKYLCINRRNEPLYRELVSQEPEVVDPNMGVVSAGQPPAADTTTPNPSASRFLA